MSLIYYILLCVVHLLATPFLFALSFREKYKTSIKKRFFIPNNHSKESYDIWLHVCSYGETNSIKSIVDSISDEENVFITTTTNTGFMQAKKLYSHRKNICIDYLAFETFLPFFAPKCKKLLVFEAELWLMLFMNAKKLGAKTKLVNARISTRSVGRYKKLSLFYKKLFSYVDSTLAQSDEDKERLQSLGAHNVEVLGNIKMLNKPLITKHYKKPERLIIIAASTHANEEELILESFRALKNKDFSKDSLAEIRNDRGGSEDNKNHIENPRRVEGETRNISRKQNNLLEKNVSEKNNNPVMLRTKSKTSLDSKENVMLNDTSVMLSGRETSFKNLDSKDSSPLAQNDDTNIILSNTHVMLSDIETSFDFKQNLESKENLDSKQTPKEQNENFLHNKSENYSTIKKDSNNPLLIIVPRHPERFDEVYNLCEKYFSTIRYTDLSVKNATMSQDEIKSCVNEIHSLTQNQDCKDSSPLAQNDDCSVMLSGSETSFKNLSFKNSSAEPQNDENSQNYITQHDKNNSYNKHTTATLDFDEIKQDILLIDSMGELINLYAISDIVLLCGSFEKIGGHNPLEVANFNNVLISGHHIFNQHALFALIENYYLIDKEALPHILESYKSLRIARLDSKSSDDMIKTILS